MCDNACSFVDVNNKTSPFESTNWRQNKPLGTVY